MSNDEEKKRKAREKTARYRKKNPEKPRKWDRDRYWNNPEKFRSKKREQYIRLDHKNIRRDYHREYGPVRYSNETYGDFGDAHRILLNLEIELRDTI